MTNISHGFLHVSEQVTDSMDALNGSNIFVFVEGGEGRSSFALTRVDANSIKHVLRIKFVPSIASPRYSREAGNIVNALTARGVLIDVRCKESVNSRENALTILEAVENIVHQTENPHLCIDLTTMPKSYFLTLLGWAVKSVGLASVRFVYSPGTYANSSAEPVPAPNAFTEGVWELKQVAHLEAQLSTDENRHLVVFVGGDLARVDEVLTRYEPLSKTLIYTRRNGDDERRATDAELHAELASYFKLANGEIVICERRSVVGSLKQLRKTFGLSNRLHGNGGLVFPFAAKLSGLAAGIYAIFDPSIALYVRVPEKYISIEIEPVGTLVVVDIVDLTHRDAVQFMV